MTVEVAASASEANADSHPLRWRMLALLAVAELLGMSIWFAGSAAAPQLRELWDLSTGQIGWLTSAVQLGFVAGTATIAILNLGDIVPGRTLFAISATVGAAMNALLLTAGGFETALATRFACGFCLAGVYPPAMKMIATWFRWRRGLAVGTVVGALTVGKATPYLLNALPRAELATIIATGSLAALAAAVLVFVFYREGPYPFPPRPFSWRLAGSVLAERRWRLATGGYLGHMFELYSYWTWIPAFIAASAIARGMSADDPLVHVLAFGVIAVGGLGCFWGGLAADRIGRERLVIRAMALSGGCALLIGLAFGASWLILAPLALAWGFFVIADSAQFSVMVTESVPAHAVGTALMIQTSMGFLLTTLTIQLVPPMVAWLGWAWAFPILALGPAAGIAAIRRLSALKGSDGPRTMKPDSSAPPRALAQTPPSPSIPTTT